MDTNSMMGLLDVIVVAAGAYILYGWYLLMFQNQVKSGLIVSKAVDGKKCKDIEGLKKALGIKLLVFAISAILSGGLGLYQTYVRPLPGAVYWIFYALFFAVLIWFGVASRKAEREFF